MVRFIRSPEGRASGERNAGPQPCSSQKAEKLQCRRSISSTFWISGP
jgi:hypothetical protein